MKILTDSILRSAVCLVLVGFVGLMEGCSDSNSSLQIPESQGTHAGTGTVTIEVVEDSETNVVEILEVHDVPQGSTVEHVMRSVEKFQVEITGSGQTAFVRSINNKSSDAVQGWTFKVDDEFATRGIGVYELSPPTKVTWNFGEFEM